MVQASGFDGVAFDPFSFKEDGLAPPEVDVGRGEIGVSGVSAHETNWLT